MTKDSVKDIRQLANFLYDAAKHEGKIDIVRGVIRRAAFETLDMYEAPDFDQPEEPDNPAEILAYFAAAWDEAERFFQDLEKENQ